MEQSRLNARGQQEFFADFRIASGVTPAEAGIQDFYPQSNADFRRSRRGQICVNLPKSADILAADPEFLPSRE
jgi:hypothetical protein